MSESAKPLSVSDVNARVRYLIEGDPALQQVEVAGELSNFKLYPSGHAYFSLKDEHSILKAVAFGAKGWLKFKPEDGMRVIATGRVGVYEQRGEFQLYATRLVEDGLGALWERFLKLKAELEREGLFEPSRKRPLPAWVRKAAIIASPEGAAVKDIIKRAEDRAIELELIIVPSLVQGQAAIADLVRAIDAAERIPGLDCIVLARGGGSLEDLWAFNEEAVVRRIFACRVPVVSAIGHERDVSLSDLVADYRAATPTSAAELITPDREDIAGHLADFRERLSRALVQNALYKEERVRAQGGRLERALTRQVEGARQRLDYAFDGLERQVSHRLEQKTDRLTSLGRRLDTLSPLSILRRGYSLVERQADGALVASIQQAPPGEKLVVRVRDGRIFTAVESAEEEPLDVTGQA